MKFSLKTLGRGGRVFHVKAISLHLVFFLNVLKTKLMDSLQLKVFEIFDITGHL